MLAHSSTPRKRTRDPLGRYYTKQKISEILVDSLSLGKSSKLLDLGSGDGALSNAARGQWSDIEIVTVDVDRHPLYFGDEKHKHFLCDALGSELPSFLKEVGYIPDVAVCNPPFIKTEWRESFSEILEQSNLSGAYKFINEAATEALFLAQNLRLVKPGGEVGIIVPDGIVSGKKHLGFRKKLLEKHCLRSVTKLPRSAFLGTDAQAYILIIKEGAGTNGDVLLGEIDDQGHLAETCLVANEKCLERLDYGFHYTIKNKGKSDRTVGELATYIGRGAFSSSERKKKILKFFTLQISLLEAKQTSLNLQAILVFRLGLKKNIIQLLCLEIFY